MIRRARQVIIPAGLLLLVLWAMMSARGATDATPPSIAASRLATVAVFLATFGALAVNLTDRLTTVALGAAGAVLVGIVFRSYWPADAALYLGGKLDTLVLLCAVGVVTGLVEEAGWFEVLARRIVRGSGGSQRRLFVRLCVLTFVLSLFMNNLVTILVLIPISLTIADALEMDGVSLVLGEVIASNLGGASTMVGDFPNMLLATEVGLPFHSFLVYLAPICILQLGILLVYLAPQFSNEPADIRAIDRQLGQARWDRAKARKGAFILVAMLVGFLVAGAAGVSPTIVAGFAALKVVAFCGIPRRRLVRFLHLDDVAFFACLFVMVGAVGATGLLDDLGVRVVSLWQREPVWGAIATAWGAALVTAVLNAGPTTALLIHVLLAGMGDSLPHPGMWWAVSLGVCAGSSATLTGATAGPVAAGLLERHGSGLTFARFAQTGLPVMFAFLGVTTAYLALLLW
jgi:Na+/H+ antiporter NhaD/arsenite permease-like protein